MKGIVSCLLVVCCACGSGAHKGGMQHLPYDQIIGFPADNEPEDLDAIVKEFPQLKGRVMTAEQYTEEYKRRMKEEGGKPFTYEYRFLAGSRGKIAVEDAPEYDKSFTVPPDGYIYMRDVGRVDLISKSRAELKTELEMRLGQFLKNPQVIVDVETTQIALTPAGGTRDLIPSGEIFVFGASTGGLFRNYYLTGAETLVNVIHSAGLPETAEWRKIRIIRRPQNDQFGQGVIIFCDLWKFFATADFRQNIPLEPGDIVFVPVRKTTEEVFRSDWQLILTYLGGILSFDSFKDSLRKGGALRD